MLLKRRLAAVLSAAMLFCLFQCFFPVSAEQAEVTAISDVPFTDVKSTKWFYDAVKAVYDAGLMNGTSDTKFDPSGVMTRAALVTLLSRLAAADTSDSGATLFFKDTRANAWYADAVGWAVNCGIVNGYEDNTFRPNAPILRQELAALLVRFFAHIGLTLEEDSGSAPFTDQARIPKWARADVEALRKTGLIKGDAGGNFNPKSTASRAEVATITYRVLDDVTAMREHPLLSLSINGVDISKFTIGYPPKTTQSVKAAADEIQKYIELAVGVKLTIAEVTSLDGYVIYLDDTMHKDDETYTIKNAGDDFIIGGSGVRGVLYGAYEFLEQCVGWRFLDASTDYMANSGNVNIADVDLTMEQYFLFRDSYWPCYMTGNSVAAAKRRLNSTTAGYVKYGGGLRNPGCHTMTKYTGVDRESQPCLSSEETYEKVLAGVLADLAADPERWSISVSQNDNKNFCKCDACLAEYAAYGHSGQMIRFVNRIAEAVEKEYPDVLIHTFAFSYTRTAPQNVVPRDNVLVQLCSNECCTNHPLENDCEKSAQFLKDLKEWSSICENLYIWDYTTNHAWYVMTHANLKYEVLAGNIRLFHEHNVKGLFEQGAYNSKGNGEFGELRAYLIAKVMQDPYMSEETYYAHMDEFLKGYYGDGWENIRKYIDFVEKGPYFDAFCYDNYTTIDVWMLIFYRKNYQWLETLFDNAESLAETELQREHVRRCRLQFTFMKINAVWADMYTFGTDETRAQILDETYAWQAEMQKYSVSLAEKYHVPDFKVITRPPMEWKHYWGNETTESTARSALKSIAALPIE